MTRKPRGWKDVRHEHPSLQEYLRELTDKLAIAFETGCHRDGDEWAMGRLWEALDSIEDATKALEGGHEQGGSARCQQCPWLAMLKERDQVNGEKEKGPYTLAPERKATLLEEIRRRNGICPDIFFSTLLSDFAARPKRGLTYQEWLNSADPKEIYEWVSLVCR